MRRALAPIGFVACACAVVIACSSGGRFASVPPDATAPPSSTTPLPDACPTTASSDCSTGRAWPNDGYFNAASIDADAGVSCKTCTPRCGVTANADGTFPLEAVPAGDCNVPNETCDMTVRALQCGASSATSKLRCRCNKSWACTFVGPDDFCGTIRPPYGEDCPDAVPTTTSDIDGLIGWKPPSEPQSVCSSTDIAQLEANFDSGKATTFLDFVAGIEATCTECLVSNKADATWGPIVLFTDDGEQGLVNYGACYASFDGADCGKLHTYENLCVDNACADCAPNDEAGVEACQAEVIAASPRGACSSIANDENVACAAAQSGDAICSDIVAGAAYLCGDAPADAGP